MKCEICHDADAVTAVTRVVNGEEDELYVCRSCADSVRKERQKKSQRTRKMPDMPPDITIAVKGSGDAPPPFVEAIIKAMSGIVGEMEHHCHEQPSSEHPPESPFSMLSLQRVDASFRINARLHLEGLFLIGELPAVKRAFHALKMDIRGVDIDGLVDVGHVYEVRYVGSRDHAAKIVRQLVDQERIARMRLLRDMRRVFGDSLCRALAILKNCRLVSGPEVFDLLSPLRLASFEGLLEGLDVRTLNNLVEKYSGLEQDDSLTPAERDKQDAMRADQMNKKFEDVILNERAEELFL